VRKTDKDLISPGAVAGSRISYLLRILNSIQRLPCDVCPSENLIMKPIGFFFLLALMINAGCNKNAGTGGDIAIYQLKSFSRVQGKCLVDPASVQLETDAIVSNNEIASYNQRSYEYTIRDAASERLQKLGDNVPLAITVGDEVIFYFINKPYYSSSTCFESITMNGMIKNKMTLTLGYPGTSASSPEDLRNDGRLINSLRNQGKLR
jgi:hypothetical protein